MIPIGGGGPGQDGMSNAMVLRATPPELVPRMKKIKVCLTVLIISLIAKIVCGSLMGNGLFSMISASLSVILISIVGIFLLNEDPFYGRIYNCCLTTICSSCQESCPGGLSCLCSWWFCNLACAIISLLPVDGSDIVLIIDGIQLLNSNPSNWGRGNIILNGVLQSVFLASMIFGLLAQIVGGLQGYQAYKEAGELATGGMMMGGAGAPSGDGGFSSGGGRYIGAGGRLEAPQQQGSDAGGRAWGRGNTFQAFQGSGQRLGG